MTENELQHSCCDVIELGASICKECGNTGKQVLEIPLRSIVKGPALEAIEYPDGFYFCETPTCGVVYFNNKHQVYTLISFFIENHYNHDTYIIANE